MRGRWAAGIVPRNFTWIIQERLAVSERPGGHAPQHRRVRRQEEIIWLKAQGFDRIVSLLPSTHNLHAYEERELPSAHFPLPLNADPRETLSNLYPALLEWLRTGERILVHQDELGERVSGVIAGFVCWCKAVPEPPRAISTVEHLLKRQMGAAGRSIVAVVPELAPPAVGLLSSAPLSPDSASPDRASPDRASPEGLSAEVPSDERAPESGGPSISVIEGGSPQKRRT